MNRGIVTRLLAVLFFGMGLLVASVVPAAATVPAPGVPAPLLAAVQQDLGLIPPAAALRLQQEADAVAAESAWRERLGPSFAGAWLDGAGRLVVATTDASRTPAIRSAGAVASVMPRSLQALDGVLAALDARARSVPDSVTGWYVDPATNSVVVSATDPAAALAFAAGVGVVRVERVAQPPRPLADLVGGETIHNEPIRCSLGFNATSGSTRFVITAGHCTQLGGTWQGVNGSPIGPVAGTSFPGNDYGLIRVDAPGWAQTGTVSNHRGGRITVTGSSEAVVGASVCRSGSTTGYRCGVIRTRNQTVNYGGGDVVAGLTRTSVCAEPGDSGGPYISGSQAQGLLSGGYGSCLPLFSGETFFQPVNEVLSNHGLRLVTG